MALSRWLHRSLALALSFTLFLTSLSLADLAHAGGAISPSLTIPPSLGMVTDSWSASDNALKVVLIQDLHLHEATQHRILSLLNHLYDRQLVSGPVAIEGTQGDYDTSLLASYPSGQIKTRLVNYFLSKGEMSGHEAFAILRGDAHRLYGVDDANYYNLNRELYKSTDAQRERLLAVLSPMEKRIATLKRGLGRAGTPSDKEVALLQNLTAIDQALPLLMKLLRQETTLADVRYVAQRLPAFAAVTEKLLELGHETVPLASIEETLKGAVDFYTVALMRDESLARNTLALLRSPAPVSHDPEKAIVLVAGGFHTAGIISEFKKAGVGYVVVTPRVESVSEEYHRLYKSRLKGEHPRLGQVSHELGLPLAELSSQAPLLTEKSVVVLMDLPFLGPIFKSAFAPSSRRRSYRAVLDLFKQYGLALSGFPVLSVVLPEDPAIPVSTTHLSRENELEALRDFHARLLREKAMPGAGLLPIVAVISDQHGTIDKFDALIVDAIDAALPGRLPKGFALNSDETLQSQLAPFGMSRESHLQGRLFVQNLADFMDRGPFGIKIFERSRELIEDFKVSDFVIGNHDFWEFMNLQAFHLPWYRGYNFYGYRDAYDDSHGIVETVVAQHAIDDKTWWAEKLAEFNAFHAKKQKERWAAVDDRINGILPPGSKTREAGLYAHVASHVSADPRAQAAWDLLRGWYGKGKIDVYTGTKAVGTFSLVRWEHLLVELQETYAIAFPDDTHSHLPAAKAWREAIDLIERDIIPELKSDLESRLNQGEWWWRAFEAINTQNYSSPEWWAKDWVYHEGWGTSVLKELNQGRTGDPITPANYLKDPTLNKIADFFRDHFALYTRDIYQNVYMHAFLPVDPDTGEFFFAYKGQIYRGKGTLTTPSVWEGLDRIAADIRNRKNEMSDLYEALSLVNSWYADNTTTAKVPDVAAAINRFGPDHLMAANGIRRLFTGHLPFHEFSKIGDKRGIISGFLTEGRIGFTDHGMGTKFGSRGAWVQVGADGLFLRGFEHETADGIVSHPRTIKTVPGVDGPTEQVLFHNPGLSREVFLPQVIKDVEARVAELLSAGPSVTERHNLMRQIIQYVEEQPDLVLTAHKVATTWSTSESSAREALERLVGIGFLKHENGISYVMRQVVGSENPSESSGPGRHVLPTVLGFLTVGGLGLFGKAVSEAGAQTVSAGVSLMPLVQVPSAFLSLPQVAPLMGWGLALGALVIGSLIIKGIQRLRQGAHERRLEKMETARVGEVLSQANAIPMDLERVTVQALAAAQTTRALMTSLIKGPAHAEADSRFQVAAALLYQA